MSRVPVGRDPSPLPPQRYTAELQSWDGPWFRYRVYRLHGIGIPERYFTYHRTLKGAERSARKWAAGNDQDEPRTIARYGDAA